MENNTSLFGNETDQNRTNVGVQGDNTDFETLVTRLRILGSCFLVITASCLITNIIIIIAFIRSKKIRRILDKILVCFASFNVFHSISTPLYPMYFFIPNLTFSSKYICLILQASLSANAYMSAFLNFGLCLERLICINKPYWYLRIENKHIIGYMGVCYGLILVTWTIPTLVWGQQRWKEYQDCRGVIPPELATTRHSITIALALLGLLFHILVVRVSVRHSRAIAEQNRTLGHFRQTNNDLKSDLHKSITVLIMIVTSCLTWLPSCVFKLLRINYPHVFNQNIYAAIDQFLFMLMLSNSLIEPLIYITRNELYREAICDLFPKRSNRIAPLEQTGRR